MKIVRSKRDGCFTKQPFKGWGHYYEPCEDPEGFNVNPKTFYVSKEFPKLPAHLYTCIYKLFKHYADFVEHKSAEAHSYEVSLLLLRKKPDFNSWLVLVPVQTVTSVSVHTDNSYCIDIFKGDKYKGLPLNEYAIAGSWHSHGTIGTFFSGTDNSDDAGCPGMHLVLGKMIGGDREIAASIMGKNGRRYLIEADRVIETELVDGVSFSPSVTELIDIKKPVPAVASNFLNLKRYPNSAPVDLEERKFFMDELDQWVEHSSSESSLDYDEEDKTYVIDEINTLLQDLPLETVEEIRNVVLELLPANYIEEF